MDEKRWRRTEELFFAADVLEGDARSAFLDRECGEDRELRRELEALLREAGPAEEDEASAVQAVALETLERHSIGPGSRVGSYEILRELGAGGMGVVYLAQRAGDEFRQLVAVKLLRVGFDREDAVMRFRMERQILANLVHPNIARLLDGGLTQGGQPFVAMEYIDGAPLLDYCRANKLTTRQKLEIFLQICAAVQCSHNNLVVHRDIKPANILMAEGGTPKLLDFGIAKLLSPDGVWADLTAALTTDTSRLLTPDYASPEQVRGETITTSTDIYSLGVLLYELLTGERPLKFKTKTATEIERVICEMEPARPGTLIKLDSELDTIVLRAMAKQPDRRYGTVVDFAADIRRYLDGFPIQARRDSTWYKARKFVSRNRLAVAVATVAMLAVIGFGIGMAWQARKAEIERDHSDIVARFMISLFEGANPDRAGAVTAKEMLDYASQRLNTLKNQPEVRHRLLSSIGVVYQTFGDWNKAQTFLEQALDIERSLSGGKSRRSADLLKNIAELQREMQRYPEAERNIRESIELYRQMEGEQNALYLEALNTLALVTQAQGRPGEAAAIFEKILLQRPVLKRRPHLETALLSNLGGAYTDMGDYPKADGYLRECIDIRRKELGPDHPRIARVTARLSRLMQIMDRLDDAESAGQETVRILLAKYGKVHPDLARALLELVYIRELRGDWQGAVIELERAEAITASPGLENAAPTATARAHLSEAKGDWGAAAALYEQLHKKQSIKPGPKSDATLRTALALGRVELQLGHTEKAAQLMEPALKKFRAVPLGDPRKAELDQAEGELRAAQGKIDESRQLLEHSLSARKRMLPQGHRDLATPLVALGQLHCATGSANEGQAALREAIRILPAHEWRLKQAQRALASCGKQH